MTKIINSPVLLQRTKLIVIKNYIYLKNFNVILPIHAASIENSLGTILLNFFGSKSVLSGIFSLSVV
jgi:hypothetical protein